MDNIKVGELIRRLRAEHRMTQLQLAEKLHISDKTVSKWERGNGCPELSLITELSRIFEVDLQDLLSGELKQNPLLANSMKQMKFYLCPDCGNLITAMADCSVSCCGRKLQAVSPVKAEDSEKLTVQRIERDFFVSSAHEMTKEHYITFVALLTADSILLKKQYPEWDLQVRIPAFGHGRLLWHCSKHGLFYQEV